MNPVFIFLVILLAVLLWFSLSFMFKPIGRLFYRLWKSVIDKVKDERNNE